MTTTRCISGHYQKDFKKYSWRVRKDTRQHLNVLWICTLYLRQKRRVNYHRGYWWIVLPPLIIVHPQYRSFLSVSQLLLIGLTLQVSGLDDKLTHSQHQCPQTCHTGPWGLLPKMNVYCHVHLVLGTAISSAMEVPILVPVQQGIPCSAAQHILRALLSDTMGASTHSLYCGVD